jgi:pyruvate dehydrogenase (quinone)
VTRTGVKNSRKTRKQTPILVGSPDPSQGGQLHSVSGTLAYMGRALPYAIAAPVAYPDRPCVAFVGDRGFSMLMAEFATCVK